ANGYTPASLINDAPFARGDYRPQNYERNFIGPITLRNAIKDSRNVPAVRLFDQLGSEKVLDFAGRFGFNVDNFARNDLTVALGSQDVQPLQMATRSEEHTSELQSRENLVCRLLLEKKKKQ